MMRKQSHQSLLLYFYIYTYVWALKRITALFALSNLGQDLSQSIQGAGGVGGLLAMVEGSNTYHYFFDANGNVGQMVDAADGTIKAAYEYSPFGKIIKQSGELADDNPFRHATQYFDKETGLIAYKFRYYDSELGRWNRRDPIEEKGGLNLYGFVGNSPINKYDFFGLKWDIHDFFDWYKNGMSVTMDLDDMGLLSDFKKSNSIQNAMRSVFESYKKMLEKRLSAECKESKKCFVADDFEAHHFNKKYNVTSASTSLFSIGKGMLFNKGTCAGFADCTNKKWSGGCELHFYIRDKFEDPWDVFNIIPGTFDTGNPYSIHGDWDASERWTGNCN